MEYSGFRGAKGYNVFRLRDTCFSTYINSPYNSPSLNNVPNATSNTLAMLSVMKYYDSKNRNVALNLAYYYYWLHESCGFYIDRTFIRKQFSLIDRVIPNMNLMKKYFHNVCQYLISRHLIFID